MLLERLKMAVTVISIVSMLAGVAFPPVRWLQTHTLAVIVMMPSGVPCSGITLIRGDQLVTTDPLGRALILGSWIGERVEVFDPHDGRYIPGPHTISSAPIIVPCRLPGAEVAYGFPS